MLVMPILNKNKKTGVSRIFNVAVTFKGASKVKAETTLKGFGEGDVIVNGVSFNDSVYRNMGKDPNTVVNFIRNNQYRSSKKDFLITTRKYSDSTFYDLYNVDIPPKKISAGLDNLLGAVLIDLQKEIPGVSVKSRYLRLKDLGVDFHITPEKIEKLRYIIENVDDHTKRDYLFAANGISDLKATVDFMNLFDFTIIEGSTIKEEEFTYFLDHFQKFGSKDYRSLKRYHEIASDNKEVYQQLSRISELIYNKPINLIHSEKEKVLVMKKGDTKNAV